MFLVNMQAFAQGYGRKQTLTTLIYILKD